MVQFGSVGRKKEHDSWMIVKNKTTVYLYSIGQDNEGIVDR